MSRLLVSTHSFLFFSAVVLTLEAITSHSKSILKDFSLSDSTWHSISRHKPEIHLKILISASSSDVSFFFFRCSLFDFLHAHCDQLNNATVEDTSATLGISRHRTRHANGSGVALGSREQVYDVHTCGHLAHGRTRMRVPVSSDVCGFRTDFDYDGINCAFPLHVSRTPASVNTPGTNAKSA